MAFSFEQLEAFIASADTGSFTGAGKKLGKAQSAISTHVANLEIELGVELFSRRTKSPTLTAAGERLLAESRAMIERREHLLGVARALDGDIDQRLCLAVDELFPRAALSELLSGFGAEFPFVEVQLLSPRMEDVSSLVLRGEADLGIMWRQEKLAPEIAFHTLGWVRLRMVCAAAHPLSQGPVSWEKLQRHRQLAPTPRGSGVEKLRLQVASDVWWIESYADIMTLAEKGLGWALVPEHLLDEAVASDLVSPEATFDLGAVVPVALEMVWRKKAPGKKAATWLRREAARIALAHLGTHSLA